MKATGIVFGLLTAVTLTFSNSASAAWGGCNSKKQCYGVERHLDPNRAYDRANAEAKRQCKVKHGKRGLTDRWINQGRGKDDKFKIKVLSRCV